MKLSFRLLFLLVIIFLLLGFGFVLGFLKLRYPTVSPFTALQYYIYSIQHPHAKTKKEIIGFLPYWRVSDIQYIRSDVVSEIIYFSLTINGKGSIVQTVNKEVEPGWRWWNSKTIKDLIAKTQITGGKFSVAFALHKKSEIEKFLDSQAAQTRLINTMKNVIQERRLNGINIDIEYSGDAGDSYRQKYTRFITNLVREVKGQYPDVEISSDFLPTDAKYKALFDCQDLGKHFDRIILMTYDYYSSGSDIAGPIAPMKGFKEDKYFYDVTTTVNDYLHYFPKDKLVLGVPYYGWDWPVEDGKTKNSRTLAYNDTNGYPAVMSYGRMRQNKDLKHDQCFWDEIAHSPWCWYTDSDNIDHQVWFENDKSITRKFEYVNQHQLAGIAIWTLGYDKEYQELWNSIMSHFSTH